MFSIPLEELHGYGMLFATEVDTIGWKWKEPTFQKDGHLCAAYRNCLTKDGLFSFIGRNRLKGLKCRVYYLPVK